MCALGAMSDQRHTRQEIQHQLLELELDDRRFALFSRKVLLGLAVLMTVASLICLLRGYAWPAPSITGGSSILSVLVLAADTRRNKRG
jgi:hypothetical protein